MRIKDLVTIILNYLASGSPKLFGSGFTLIIEGLRFIGVHLHSLQRRYDLIGRKNLQQVVCLDTRARTKINE